MIIGICLIVLGLIIRIIAMKTLGKEFSQIIKRPEKVVKTGIYKYYKHPAYLGSMLIILGASLINNIFGILTISWAFYKSRMVIEDILIKDVENKGV